MSHTIRVQTVRTAANDALLFRCATCSQCRAQSAHSRRAACVQCRAQCAALPLRNLCSTTRTTCCTSGAQVVQSEAMQSAQLQTLSESPLAAKPQLSEKPRLGFETKKTAGKPGPSVCNFTVTLGLRATVIENGVRKTYSARYYNPATGRFLSRDPENGQPTDPQSLHKYLYAGGDPTSAFDPSGRADIFETGKLLDRAARQTALVTFAVRTAVLDLFCFILSGIEQNANLGHLPDPVPPGPSFACWWSSGVATVTTIIALVAHALVAAAP